MSSKTRAVVGVEGNDVDSSVSGGSWRAGVLFVGPKSCFSERCGSLEMLFDPVDQRSEGAPREAGLVPFF